MRLKGASALLARLTKLQHKWLQYLFCFCFSNHCSLDEDTFFPIFIYQCTSVLMHISFPLLLHFLVWSPLSPRHHGPPDLVGFASICEESPRARQWWWPLWWVHRHWLLLLLLVWHGTITLIIVIVQPTTFTIHGSCSWDDPCVFLFLSSSWSLCCFIVYRVWKKSFKMDSDVLMIAVVWGLHGNFFSFFFTWIRLWRCNTLIDTVCKQKWLDTGSLAVYKFALGWW